MRKSIVIIVSCIIVLLLGYTGYRGYKVWKQSHWLTMAKQYAAKADTRNESLSLQQVLSLNPQNTEACRMMADLADAVHSPGALVWRLRVVDLNPTSLTDRLALTQTAMALSDFNVASNALAGVDAAGQKTAVYQNAAGLLAAAAGQRATAEARFAEAVRIDPSNLIPQLNLAALRLHSTNSLDMAEARINLKRISLNTTNPAIGNQAKRELVMDAVRFEDFKTALALTKEMVQATNAPFADRLLRLEVLRMAKSPEFKADLVSCQREAAAGPVTKLSSMAVWLMRNTSPTETLPWLRSLPPQVQTNPPVAMYITECNISLGNWHQLQVFLQNQNWSNLEFVRHAYLARALREQSLNEASFAEWGVALNFANDRKFARQPGVSQKGILLLLFKMAGTWHWNNEAEQILWALVNQYPEERWASPVLVQSLMTGGRTRPLMQLFATLSKREPNDMEVKNNLAYTALLLGAQELDPNGLAKEVYAKDPQNASYASTYAFSLYLQKRNAEALQVMQKLTPKQLGDPSVAGYYGLILKATGNAEKAKNYLKLTAGAKLLPEESKLFQQALAN